MRAHLSKKYEWFSVVQDNVSIDHDIAYSSTSTFVRRDFRRTAYPSSSAFYSGVIIFPKGLISENIFMYYLN